MSPFGPGYGWGYGASGMEASFGDRTFYGGYLTGFRSWRVEKDGTLRPAVTSIPYVWTEGENLAQCFRTQVITGALPVRSEVPIYDGEGNVVGTTKKHEVASKVCSCGFYAYFPGKGSHHSAGNISGLVKGTGRVVRGPKGFRSEKAEILAFIRPSAPTNIHGDLLESVLSQYSTIPVFESLKEATAEFPISSFSADTAVAKK
jgi:hypothetical protein